MTELAIIILILALFIFPLYKSAGCLGLYTIWLLYKNYESFKKPILRRKKVLSTLRTSFFINIIASLILGAQLTWLVYFFIYDFFIYSFLILFSNLYPLVCFLLSVFSAIDNRAFCKKDDCGHFFLLFARALKKIQFRAISCFYRRRLLKYQE